MSHSYHEPGKQLVFSDTCHECQRRVNQGVAGFRLVDNDNLSVLWDARNNHPDLEGRHRSTLDRHAIWLLKEAVLVANRIGDLT